MPLSNSKSGSCETCSTGFDFFKKIITALACVLIVYGIIYMDTLVNFKSKEFQYIGKAPRMERTIMVQGYGKVTGKNDIAVTSMSYSNLDKDVATAQANNSKVMDQIMADLKKMNIDENDLTSQYFINQEYDYPPNLPRVLKGYRVSNTLVIKIRDLTKITPVLNLAGKYGMTDVGGLNFTIDDQENLKNEAREKALLDARQKAQKLSEKLGVRLIAIINYNEYNSLPYSASPYYGDMGLGGASETATRDSVASGGKDVEMNVTITYEIAP